MSDLPDENRASQKLTLKDAGIAVGIVASAVLVVVVLAIIGNAMVGAVGAVGFPVIPAIYITRYAIRWLDRRL